MQADFAHSGLGASAPSFARDAVGLPIGVSIYADGPDTRERLRSDIAAAGLAVHACAPLSELLGGDPGALGEVVLLDCPAADTASLAALARLDMRARRAGAHVIVSTSALALEEVFACCDQCGAQILVDASPAERMMAVGRSLARIPNLRLADLSQGDRAALLQLTEQLGEIARRLTLTPNVQVIRGEDRAYKVESPVAAFAGAAAQRPVRPMLPDPRLVRRVIRQRQQRSRFFDNGLFADPAWDILLDLTAAAAEGTRVSVTSLCIASGVPPTTALRWIGQMCDSGLLRRVPDEADRRRAFIALTEDAQAAMAGYFASLEPASLLAA